MVVMMMTIRLDNNDHDNHGGDDDGENVFWARAMERLIIVNRIDDAHVNRRQWIELAINIKKGKRRWWWSQFFWWWWGWRQTNILCCFPKPWYFSCENLAASIIIYENWSLLHRWKVELIFIRFINSYLPFHFSFGTFMTIRESVCWSSYTQWHQYKNSWYSVTIKTAWREIIKK